MVGLGNAGGKNFPLISTGDAQIGLGFGNNGDNVDNGLRLNDAIVWTHGRHNVKIGGDVRYQQYSPINGRNEYIDFSGNETAGAIAQGGGLGFASLMLGEADNGGTNVVLRGQRWISWYYAVFAQDDFKITPTLTLNLGLRYDVDMPRTEAHNDTSNFSPTASRHRIQHSGRPGVRRQMPLQHALGEYLVQGLRSAHRLCMVS